MKMKRKAIPFLLAFVMGLTTLSGCGNSSNDETDNEQIQGEVTEPVVVNMNDPDNTDYGKLYYAPIEEGHIAGEESMKYVDNEILIVVKDDVSEEQVKQLAEKYNGVIVGEIEVSGDYQLRLSDVKTKSELGDLVKLIETEDIIASASLNYVTEAFGMSETEECDGYYFGEKWQGDLQNWNDCLGKSWGFEAINTIGAWDNLNDHKDEVNPVRVGLIDTGFDVDHEDLGFAEVFYDNGKNGVTSDEKDHGTNVAGIMAAKTVDKKGICGVYPYGDGNLYGVSNSYGISDINNKNGVMSVKIALAELIVRNVKVINSSQGIFWKHQKGFEEWYDKTATDDHFKDEPFFANEIGAFLQRMLDKKYDFVIVSSAGNNSDVIPTRFDCRYTWYLNGIPEDRFPEVYKRIIVVGALNNAMKIAPYSDGGNRVDIYAPGGDHYELKGFFDFTSNFSLGINGSLILNNMAIFSTMDNNGYGALSGTSQAAPHVAGVAAMVWSANHELKGYQVKDIILDNSSYKGPACYMVNAERAVRAAFDKTTMNDNKNPESGGVLSYVVEHDNESNIIYKAKVTLKNANDGTPYETETDWKGHFEIMVPEGQYTLSVKAEGYNDYTWPDGDEHQDLINVRKEEINYLDWIKLTKKDPNDKTSDNPGVNLGNLNEGDYITFGSYEQDGNTENGKEPVEWIVVHKESDGSALLMSRYALDNKSYHDTSDANMRWESSTIRQWLNSSFYNDAFNAEEKNMIREVELSNGEYDSGEITTSKDQVFLLSLNEIKNYFLKTEGEQTNFNRPYYSELLWCEPTQYARTMGAIPEWAEGEKYCSWFLRTTYGGHVLFANDNAVWVDENPATLSEAIRPAIWIRSGTGQGNGEITTESDTGQDDGHDENWTYSSVDVGDYITFGSYEQDNNTANGPESIRWKVLAKENGKLFLVSEYGLDAKPYNEEYEDVVTWETCTLRSWLNNDFYNTAFSSSEKTKIQTTKVVNADNPGYGTEGGNDTEDKVFLLSLDETRQYFDIDTNIEDNVDGAHYYGAGYDIACKPTEYAQAQGAVVRGKEKNAWWWLRSPGRQPYNAANVSSDLIRSIGSMVDIKQGSVRPAIWITP